MTPEEWIRREQEQFDFDYPIWVDIAGVIWVAVFALMLVLMGK